ncbi:MAG: DUF3343 domain-containing protein [Clostridia bacterium]|nr:DUF3343 domain-containing protein [Clostridia bacterium]
MKRYVIITGTVTYAIRGRDILRKEGFRATVERNTVGIARYGCGYGIVLNGNIEKAVEILNESGIKILEVSPVN